MEPNEDPVQATLREVLEETGLDVRVLPTSVPPDISNLEQVLPPFTVMIEDVFDQQHGEHQHIDFIYFTTPLARYASGLPAVPGGWQWVTREQLVTAAPLRSPAGELVAPPEDVIKLSITALDVLESVSSALQLPATD